MLISVIIAFDFDLIIFNVNVTGCFTAEQWLDFACKVLYYRYWTIDELTIHLVYLSYSFSSFVLPFLPSSWKNSMWRNTFTMAIPRNHRKKNADRWKKARARESKMTDICPSRFFAVQKLLAVGRWSTQFNRRSKVTMILAAIIFVLVPFSFLAYCMSNIFSNIFLLQKRRKKVVIFLRIYFLILFLLWHTHFFRYLVILYFSLI